MKKFLTVLIVIMIFATNAVFAGGFGENEHKKHGKQEQEQKQEQNQNQKQQQSVEVITGDVSATGGNATIESGAASSNSSSSIGDISSSQSVNIESPTGVPLINPSSPPEVQLYQLSATAVEKGVDITLFYNEACKPVNSKEFPLESREEKIKKIQIVFTPHQDYLMEESKGKKSEVKEVRTELPEEKVKCLGVLNIESVAKKNIPLSQINAEAGNYVILNLGGFEKIYLVDMKNAVAAARGVNNSGFGAFLAPGQSWLLGSATGAIGGGLSYGKGNAFNATRLGTTFIVLGSDSDGMIFKLPEPSKQTKEPEKAIEKPLSEEKRVVIEIITPQLQPAPQPQVISEPEKKKEKPKKKDISRHYIIPNWE